MELGDYVGKLSIVRVIWHPTINLNGHLLFLQYNCLWKLNIFTLSSWMFRFWSFLRSFARNVISEKCFLGNSLEFCKEKVPAIRFFGWKESWEFLDKVSIPGDDLRRSFSPSWLSKMFKSTQNFSQRVTNWQKQFSLGRMCLSLLEKWMTPNGIDFLHLNEPSKVTGEELFAFPKHFGAPKTVREKSEISRPQLTLNL